MPEFKLKKWVAAGLIVSMPYAGMVNAAGLGGMNVLSQIGQPFSAEIELVNVSKEELATLSATLAAPNAYRAANLQFNPALNSMRLAVERRADGRPFIRVTSSRPVAEPFLDILIELSWQGGRIVREYSALLDPPGLEIPAPVVTAPVIAAPATKPAPAGKAPAAVATPAPAAAAPAARPAPAPVAKPESVSRPITGSEYAVKQGDTLGQIAAGLKPEGISLDQMMIGLLRANPDAFINNNINLVKAGRILKAPERDQLAAIVPGEASQQVRAQATDWNSYRAKVADTAPAATEAAPATKGKITARVEDKVAPGAKDVVVISKGEATKGKDGKAGVDRVRALEEDVAAKDKALAEAKDRVAALEKTVEQMKKLAEIKIPAMAAAQPAGKGDAKADAKAAPKPEPKAEPVRKAEAPKAEPTKAEPPKAEPAKAEPPKAETPKAEPAKADGAKPDEKAAVAEAPKPDPAPTPKAAPPALPAPSTPPVPKAAAKAAPPQEPGIMDAVMENILPIGGGAALAGLAGFWAFRRTPVCYTRRLGQNL